MLQLTLSKKERLIHLGTNITVELLSGGGNVKIGVSASDEVPVYRGALYQERELEGKNTVELVVAPKVLDTGVAGLETIVAHTQKDEFVKLMKKGVQFCNLTCAQLELLYDITVKASGKVSDTNRILKAC